jgi:hypothetical protein
MDGNSGGLDAALLAKHRAVCENALQRLTSELGPEDVAARNGAYAKIRDSNESFIAKNQGKFGDGGTAALRGVVEEIIAQDVRDNWRSAAPNGADLAFRPVAEAGSVNRTKETPPRQRRSALFGGLVGAGLAVLAGFGLWIVDGAWSSAPSPTEQQREFEAQLEKSLPKIDVAVVFRSVLCTAVEFARPAMVDPKRNHEGLGCEFFGVWNEAGAKI